MPMLSLVVAALAAAKTKHENCAIPDADLPPPPATTEPVVPLVTKAVEPSGGYAQWMEGDTPVRYKEVMLDQLSFVGDEFTRIEFDRHKIAEFCSNLEGGCNFFDLCCGFGNAVLALVNGMSVDQLKENWADAEACKRVQVPRRFSATVTGIDILGPAVRYAQAAGILDRGIEMDLNQWNAQEQASIGALMAEQDVLCSSAALIFLNLDTIDFLFGKFASKQSPGYVIVTFINPYELQKADQIKQLLLRHFDFVGSRCSKGRRRRRRSQWQTRREGVETREDGHDDWTLVEIWTLKRRVHGP